MAERIPFSIPGSLETWEDVDHAIGVLGIAGTIIRVHMLVTDAPSGEDLIVDLRDAIDDGGDGITVTIADGTNSETDAVSTLAISSSETVYLRVEQAGGAMNLSGWFEFQTGAEEVTTFLTTLSRVKTDEGIDSADYDAVLSRMIQGVSDAMQKWMGRTIVDTTYTDEVHSGNGWTDRIVLKHRPVTDTETMVVKVSDSAVDSSTYETDDDSGILYAVDSVWESGSRNIKVTYSAGYLAVPEGLAHAATEQVRHVWHQSSDGGARLGITRNADAGGGSTDYLSSEFLPSVIEAMRPYKRIA
jgi:hypothetical protein